MGSLLDSYHPIRASTEGSPSGVVGSRKKMRKGGNKIFRKIKHTLKLRRQML